MDVRCNKCGSEYELDDDRVTAQGVSVKCTTCNNVFRVAKPAAATRAQSGGDWMIRQANGQVFKFKELTTLQRWIVERRVAREDEISKTGESWKRLGDILELASFFQVAEQANLVPEQHGHTPAPLGAQVVDDDPRPRRSLLPLAIVVSMVAVAAVGGVFIFRHEIVAALRGAPPAPPVAALDPNAAALIEQGRAALKRDSATALAAAEQSFDKALALTPKSPAALAGAAMTLASWADNVGDDATELDEKLKAAAAGKVAVAPAELAALAVELGKKQADVAARSERALSFKTRLAEAAPGANELVRVGLRLDALARSRPAFDASYDKLTPAQRDDVDVQYALGMMRLRGDDGLETAVAAFSAILEKDPEHHAARFRLALAQERLNKPEAMATAEAVVARVPDHAQALALVARLKAKQEAAQPVKTPPETAAGKPEPQKPAEPAKESFNDLLAKANRARQSERFKQAVDFYQRAIDLKPDNSEALAGLGFAYLDLEQPGNAIAQFQRAVSANGRYSDAHMGLAEAYRARGQKRDAVKHYQRYLDLAPNGAEANVAREALKQLGQGD